VKSNKTLRLGLFNGAVRISYELTNFDPILTPLPAALPLFASGLVGLGLLGWRRKKKAASEVLFAHRRIKPRATCSGVLFLLWSVAQEFGAGH
jgi:hypothetical protein